MCSHGTIGKLKSAEVNKVAIVLDEAQPDKLSLALEPEVAAIYCQGMQKTHLAKFADNDLKFPFTSNAYIVVDIGGGTVDISVHQVTMEPDYHLSVITPPAGNECGGSMVNKQFIKYLETLVNDEGFSCFLNTDDEIEHAVNLGELKMLEYDTFEKQKRIFADSDDAEDTDIAIQLPYNFLKCYNRKLLDNTGVRLRRDRLLITRSQMREFFEPVVSGLLECISESLNKVPEHLEIDTFYIVGGFGGCKYVSKAIQNRFCSKYKYVIPEQPDFAVVWGAIMARQKPDTVKARTVDATYGVQACLPFIDGIHEDSYKNSESICENIFSTFVEIGDTIEVGNVFIQSYPVDSRQSCVDIRIYRATEKDVWYTTGKRPKTSAKTDKVDIQPLGNLTIPLSFAAYDAENASIKHDIIQVRFDFSQTEIQVQAFNQTTKTDVKVVLDFFCT